MLERMDAVSRFASVVLIELISRLDTVYLDNDIFVLTFHMLTIPIQAFLFLPS